MVENRFIVVNYTLHAIDNGKEEFIEQTAENKPFVFISGKDMVLDGLEEVLSKLNANETFEITLSPEQAFGPRKEDKKFFLDKKVFYHEGKFDEENVYKGATISLSDGRGNSYDANVVDVTDDKVIVEIDADLNHPLAGKTLVFRGKVIENREATQEELRKLEESQSCGCGHCNGDCGKDKCSS